MTAMNPTKTEEETESNARPEGRGRNPRDYLPLVTLVVLTTLAAGAKQVHYAGTWEWPAWMHDFMGFFLVVFAMLKLFDLRGFADGFQMYDLLGRRFRAYALMYPLIELSLGLGYLSHLLPVGVYVTTVVVMLFGAIGVLRALSRGLDVECACMGSVLSVPLSTVALVENIGMAVMASAMLLR